jgi:hypothetical protein
VNFPAVAATENASQDEERDYRWRASVGMANETNRLANGFQVISTSRL